MSRYPRGLTWTPKGWRLTVSRGPTEPPWRKRYPPTTPQAVVEDALLAARKKLRGGTGAISGTLAADMARYLKDHFTGRPGYEERDRHLALWLTALGAQTLRETITRHDVARVLNQWKIGGLAAETCNKRRTALLALFHVLDGHGASNPVREVPKFRAPDPLPRGLAYGQIEAALEQLPRCKTKARLRVLAYTGMRHGQLMALTPDHWNVKARRLTVPGTLKGRGTKPYTIPLSQQAHDALTELDALDGWGRFTWAPMARMWKAAATKAKLPEGTVPYDLRHSFGTKVYQESGDLKATKDLMGHASLRVTERYTLAAVPARQRAALAAFETKVTTELTTRKKSRRKTA